MKATHTIFEGMVGKEICDRIIYENDDNLHVAKVGTGQTRESVRVSSIKWLDDDEISGIMKDAINLSNSMDFGFLLQGEFECQYTSYGDGGKYDQHLDVAFNDQSFDRKLTSILMLSDSSDYEGGDLIVMDQKMIFNKGDVIVFPSFMPHQVCKITSGVRKVVVRSKLHVMIIYVYTWRINNIGTFIGAPI